MKEYKYQKYFTYEGHRYKVVGDTLEEVLEKKIKKIEELKSNSVILSPGTTVDKWAEVAYNTYKGHVKGLPEMKLRYQKYISPVIGFLPISSVKPVQLQNILNDCSGMSFSHLSKLRMEIRFLFYTAFDNQMIKTDPAKKLIIPDYTKGKRRTITDYEREVLYKVVEIYHPLLFFRIMLETGSRPSEVMELEGRDIDHKNRLLHIRGTKTVNSDRYVPIPEGLYRSIKDIKGFTPISTSTGRKFDKDAYTRLRNRLKREMNIAMGCKVYRNELIPPYPLAEDFTPYCLRHTYCTDLCKAGVDVRTAQRLMGHSNIGITADIYTHVDTDEILKAGELIEIYNTAATPAATPN